MQQQISFESQERLVYKVLKSVQKTYPQILATKEDALQDGWVGLLDAMDKYVEDHETSFETYAHIRITGAIIDGLRRMYVGHRSTARFQRHLKIANTALEQKLGRLPKDRELATALDMSLEEFETERAVLVCLLTVEDLDSFRDCRKLKECRRDHDPEAMAWLLEQEDFLGRAKALIDNERSLQILQYYNEGLEGKEIAKRIEGIAHHRVWQILRELREFLEKEILRMTQGVCKE